MWTGYESALQLYQNYTIQEWISRGYKNTMLLEDFDMNSVVMPHWFGLEEFHRSHRSNLLRKDYEYYSQYFDEDPNLPYYWPAKEVVNAN
jgi:hypothetical protein